MYNIFKWRLDVKWIIALLCFEFLLCSLIVSKIKYTEIDWKAYMEEVEGFLSGERDYTKIEGNTGPLVYPAGFLYVFALFRILTDSGRNIFSAQMIFIGVYVFNLATVLVLYLKVGNVALITSALLVLSKRVHSIFILRLFNDCIAVLFGYLAILLFTKSKWRLGCLFYSMGVSIKMNMLLHAPGILLVLLVGTGYAETFICLSICAATQLVLGYPFLSTYPLQYLSKSFELGRVFMHQWTVNFKFLPEDVFVSKTLSVALLAATVLAFVLFARKWILESTRHVKAARTNGDSIIGIGNLSPSFVVTVIFTSNFVGVVFARSLHYQFYCWYFHMVPLLLSHVSHVPVAVKAVMWLAIELCFNVFPATPLSSATLQVTHLLLLVALYFTPTPSPVLLSISPKTE